MDDKSTTARQLASTSVMEGGTDPGDDPTTPPIPVGEGFWIMLFLALLYLGWKTKIWE